MEKVCPKCSKSKPVSEFSRNIAQYDGLQSWCKECKTEQQRIYRQTAKGKAAQKRYEQSEKGKTVRRRQVKRYYQSEKGKATYKRYYQSETVKATHRANAKRYREAHPDRTKARNAVSHAVAAGRLPRISTQTCKCGDPAKHYHHHSYEPEYWLDVEAMCQEHHGEIHFGKIAI